MWERQWENVSKNQHLMIYSVLKWKLGVPLLWRTLKYKSPDIMRYWQRSTFPISSHMIHPQDSSCSVSKSPRERLFYPVLAWRQPSLWHLHVHQTSHCIKHTQINTASLSLTKQNKIKPISTYKSMYSEKINMETFQNFKSQCSVTKHIIPLIKLTYYTWVVLPKDI